MEAFQALLGDDFCFLLSPHIVARTPRKRPIMTSDHADKMEITVVFQCPPKGGRSTKPPKTQQEWTPAPWGGLGRGIRRAGEGLLPSSCFVPAPAGLFLPPTAAFFTVVTAGVMHRMTVGMAVTTRRKTCFPTVGTTGTTKAKPPAVPTAFCVYFSPVWVEQIKAHSGMPTSSGNSVGVAIPQPRVAGEARYPG